MSRQGIHILMIGPYPLEPGKVVGGIEAVTSALVPALAAQEQVAKVTMLCFRQDIAAARREQVSEKLQVLHVKGQQKLRLISRSLFNVWQARRLMAELQPDIVHGHGIGRQADVTIQLTNSPEITVHGLVHREAALLNDQSLKGQFRRRVVEQTVERILSQARVVISISDYDARSLAGMIRGQRVSVPNPIAAEFFAAGPSFEGSDVLFAGVLSPRKNPEGLLNAFAKVRQRIPTARLVIVGPQPNPTYTQKIREQVHTLQLDDAVTFVGHVENDELIARLRACAVLALFSHEETSPTIIAQALALGKPVVASRVGGIGEMITDGETGYLVDPGDEHALADRLALLLESPRLRRLMGSAGHDIACSRYESGAVARRTIDAYQLALSPSSILLNTQQRSSI